jgi:hypothetical protein
MTQPATGSVESTLPSNLRRIQAEAGLVPEQVETLRTLLSDRRKSLLREQQEHLDVRFPPSDPISEAEEDAARTNQQKRTRPEPISRRPCWAWQSRSALCSSSSSAHYGRSRTARTVCPRKAAIRSPSNAYWHCPGRDSWHRNRRCWSARHGAVGSGSAEPAGSLGLAQLVTIRSTGLWRAGLGPPYASVRVEALAAASHRLVRRPPPPRGRTAEPAAADLRHTIDPGPLGREKDVAASQAPERR